MTTQAGNGIEETQQDVGEAAEGGKTCGEISWRPFDLVSLALTEAKGGEVVQLAGMEAAIACSPAGTVRAGRHARRRSH